MANSDYIQNGIGAFCTFVKINKLLDREDVEFTYTDFNFSVSSGVQAGMAGMIDDEIVRVEEVGLLSFTVKRGCADTVPALHAAGALCWLFNDSTGTDGREYGAGETIGVKVAPFTTGGVFDIALAAPDTVTFDFRFARPYAPGQLRVNGQRWHVGTDVTEDEPNARITWVHRDRVLQADQLLGHDDPSIGPEPGVTYSMRVHDAVSNVLRQEDGIIGQVFTYQWAQMVNDFGYPDGPRAGYFTIFAMRDDLTSFQWYICPFTVDPAGTLTSQYMAFQTGVMESPYRQNLVHALDPAANYLIGLAARPSDRMSDACDFLIQGSISSFARSTYTPWLTSEFRLPELETTFNVRSSSLYDGVAVAASNVGKLASIGQEIVQVAAMSGNTVTLLRGCLDTVPQAHTAGARLWFFEQASNTGTTPYQPGEPLITRFRPGVYGPMIPTEDLPAQTNYVGARSIRPYPPGQLVINGRPWFEEAAPINGGPIAFSWARRNRITQGIEIYDHAQDDVAPEAGQVTRIVFYYNTPATEPGGAAVQHILRQVDVAGTSYSYTYDLALADGQEAGMATGTCGTVVIGVAINSLRDDALSYQGYNVALRLPSYPCAG